MGKNELLSLIEKKRSELIIAASKYGLSSNHALERSQELDRLLNQYDQTFIKNEYSKSFSY